MSETKVQVKDSSGDRKYFWMTPEIVLAKSPSPYHFTVWSVVKMVCGENGECNANFRSLAMMAGISIGKLGKTLDELLAIGLLGGIKGENGKYRLFIPDLWDDNIKWRNNAGNKIKERAEVYKKNRDEIKQSVHVMNNKNCSPDEQSVHDMNKTGKNCSPDERHLKKNKDKNQKKILRSPAKNGGTNGQTRVDKSSVEYRAAKYCIEQILVTHEHLEKTLKNAKMIREAAEEFEKLHRIDGHSWQDIARVLKWLPDSPVNERTGFSWSAQIQSPKKFRRKDNDGIMYFDKLLGSMKAGNNGREHVSAVYHEKWKPAWEKN